MAVNFIYSNREHKFIVKEWLDMEKVFNFEAFKDIFGMEDVDIILDQALKFTKEVIAPTNEDGDRIGVVFENGKVTTPPSFHTLYKKMQDIGYGSSEHDPEEADLPDTLKFFMKEFFNAGNCAFMGYFGLAGGAMKLIKLFGRDEDKKHFLPNMYAGKWGGTMCLTEPGAGTDSGSITTKALATDDPRIYKIKGTKCFITAGDHDLTENIVHLLLARCEGAVPGTAGLSLFIVPKMWANEDGSLEPNDVTTVAIEHKMGLKGSATAMLSFGDNDNCRSILLGNARDENGRAAGMYQMFVMMNGARQGTGMQALALAQAAYYASLQYAKERIQGKAITNPKGPRVRIIEHEDIKRMLLSQKSILEACRAMLSKSTYYGDVAKYSGDPEERKMAERRIEINNPLIKAYPSDMAWLTTADAIQVHGGYGFIEEYPVAQAARDCKIMSLWEGTNYIQSMDLLGRKWMMDKGKVFMEWLADVEASIESNKNLESMERECQIMKRAIATYKEIQGFISGLKNVQIAPVYSTRILHATAMLYGGSLLLEQAAIAAQRIKELGEGHYDYPFYQGKVQSAKFYIRNIVPQIFITAEVVKDCDTSVLDILEDAL